MFRTFAIPIYGAHSSRERRAFGTIVLMTWNIVQWPLAFAPDAEQDWE